MEDLTYTKAFDSMNRPSDREGYVAERHPLLNHLIVVWAPCGCNQVCNGTSSCMTSCGKATCVFEYEDAYEAIELLKRMEEGERNGGPVIARPVDSRVPDVDSDSLQDGPKGSHPAEVAPAEGDKDDSAPS